jgi:hypothetical protein
MMYKTLVELLNETQRDYPGKTLQIIYLTRESMRALNFSWPIANEDMIIIPPRVIDRDKPTCENCHYHCIRNMVDEDGNLQWFGDCNNKTPLEPVDGILPSTHCELHKFKE